MKDVPQPSPARLTEFSGSPIVVGVTPGQNELVPITAASWARALGVRLVCAYVDTQRTTVEEFPDGSVRHVSIEPDVADDTWQRTEAALLEQLGGVLTDVEWEFHYLAGRVDRSLTHLARAVDASAIVVGTRVPGLGARVRQFVEGSVALHLSHHQHRPVLVVPLAVVDWFTKRPWGA
ncbi:Nucleotide-binding universal stress protein, UspA family [Ruaniaceae bacterium KH17]|nr:Nucleotide-binding universal stress protein, UspA family [Ruaniaceae bacterium KH17]